MAESPPMPEEGNGRTAFKQLGNLNYFGKKVVALNVILKTNQKEMAKICGVQGSTLSINTRNPGGPSKEIVLLLVPAYQGLSVEKKIALPVGWELLLYMAWLKPGISREMDQASNNLESSAAIITERNKLRRQVETLSGKRLADKLLTALEENEELRKKNEALTEEVEQLRGIRENA